MKFTEFTERLKPLLEQDSTTALAAIELALDYVHKEIHLDQVEAGKTEDFYRTYQDMLAGIYTALGKMNDEDRERLTEASANMHYARGQYSAYMRAFSRISEARYCARRASKELKDE